MIQKVLQYTDFLRYMLEKNKTKYLLEMTIDVMINPLCFVEGAYEVALFHTRELLKIDFSVETMEKVIFFTIFRKTG